MSRAAVYTLVNNDATLDSIGLKKVFAFQAVDTPAASDKPFVVIRWDVMDPGVVASRGAHVVTFWVYDVPADYARIDSIIARIKTLMLGAVHVIGNDGMTLTLAEWTGDSEDLFDDVYSCVLRTTSFRVISRPT
jgi:hypothetical protein